MYQEILRPVADRVGGQDEGAGAGCQDEGVGVGSGVVGGGVLGAGVVDAGVVGAGLVGAGAGDVGGGPGSGGLAPVGPRPGGEEPDGGDWPWPVSETGSSPSCAGVSIPGSGGTRRWCLCRCATVGGLTSGAITVVAGVGLWLARTARTEEDRGAWDASASR